MYIFYENESSPFEKALLDNLPQDLFSKKFTRSNHGIKELSQTNAILYRLFTSKTPPVPPPPSPQNPRRTCRGLDTCGDIEVTGHRYKDGKGAALAKDTKESSARWSIRRHSQFFFAICSEQEPPKKNGLLKGLYHDVDRKHGEEQHCG